MVFGLAACQAPSPTSTKGAQAPSRPKITRTDSQASPAAPQPSASAEGPRQVDPATARITLVGGVRMIAEKALGVVSNGSGNVISNNGGGLISDKGLGIIGDNGAGYITLQAGGTSAVPEAWLADARVEVLDGSGRVLTDAEGQAISATTDRQGRYRLEAALPAENLVLRVKLYNGGELGGLLAVSEAATGERTLDIGTASSYAATYVLDRYVKGSSQVLNRLPLAEAEALVAAAEGARFRLAPGAPSYLPADMVAATETLRAQDPPLQKALERVEALLLAGQRDLGNGLPATQVSLGTPSSVVGDGKGLLYIAEGTAGRIRLVGSDGLIRPYAGAGLSRDAEGKPVSFSGITSIKLGPDGSLYVADALQNRIMRILPDGVVQRVAGTGTREQGAVGGPARETSLVVPGDVAIGPDGKLYIGELPSAAGWSKATGRLLETDGAGRLLEVARPEPEWQLGWLTGLGLGQDGTLYVSEGRRGKLARRAPGKAWEFVRDLKPGDYNRVAVAPDGSVYFSESSAHTVSRLKTDGTVERVVGTGKPGYAGDGGPASAALLSVPAGIWLAPDGELFVADGGNGLIRAVKDGVIRTVAGTQGLTQQGDALAMAVNQPAAITADAQGRLVFSELGSSMIKRLDDGKLQILAGLSRGNAGNGGPATEAQFNVVSGLAYAGDVLYASDMNNRQIRRITASGQVELVAGAGATGFPGQAKRPAIGAPMRQPMGLAVGPEGLPYWADLNSHVVMRLTAAGEAEVVVGGLNGETGDSGDGGPAQAARLNRPIAVAFDAEGQLYIADAGNFRIRRVAKDGTMSTVAGMPVLASLARLQAGPLEEGALATESVLVAPSYMVFDAKGNMYVAEVGKYGIATIQGTNGLSPDLLPESPARIRKITPDGRITTVAGPGGRVLAKPGELQIPIGLVLDGQGALVIADSGTNQILRVPAEAL